MKPNFAYLSRKYNIDPRTIKKYYYGYNGKPTTRVKPSNLDKHYKIIKEKLSYKGARISSIYFAIASPKKFYAKSIHCTIFTTLYHFHPIYFKVLFDKVLTSRIETIRVAQQGGFS